MNNIVDSTETADKATLSTVKTICFFQGNQLTLKKDALIECNELIVVSLKNVVPEDLVEELDDNIIIWSDKDEILSNTRYLFDKFYILPNANLIVDSGGCISSMNTLGIHSVHYFTKEQKLRRENRIEKTLKRKPEDTLESLKNKKLC